MKKILCLLIVLSMLITGCDVSTKTYKPGAFGAAAEDQEMLGFYTEQFGDLQETGTPKFIEAFMTKEVKEYIPQDNVKSFSKDTKYITVWFIYDNFQDGDQISVNWKYLETGETITPKPLTTTATGDFGRGTSTLEQPDAGWPEGKYLVEISGNNIQKDVNFEIKETELIEEVPFKKEAAKIIDQKKSTEATPKSPITNPIDTVPVADPISDPIPTGPVCGDGICDDTERCDKCEEDCSCKDKEQCYLGACLEVKCEKSSECNDEDACTIDTCFVPGSISSYCQNSKKTTCKNDDGCCPSSCNTELDSDCSPKWETGDINMPVALLTAEHYFFDFSKGGTTTDFNNGDLFFNNYGDIMEECNNAGVCVGLIASSKDFDDMITPPTSGWDDYTDQNYATPGNKFWVKTLEGNYGKIEITDFYNRTSNDLTTYYVSFNWGYLN